VPVIVKLHGCHSQSMQLLPFNRFVHFTVNLCLLTSVALPNDTQRSASPAKTTFSALQVASRTVSTPCGAIITRASASVPAAWRPTSPALAAWLTVSGWVLRAVGLHRQVEGVGLRWNIRIRRQARLAASQLHGLQQKAAHCEMHKV